MLYLQNFNNHEEQLINEKINNYTNDDIVIAKNYSNSYVSWSNDMKVNHQCIVETTNPSKYTDFLPYFNEFNILPNDIKSVKLIDKRNNIVLKKYTKSLPDKQPLYSVGLISDIHYNDTDDSEAVISDTRDPDTYTEDGSEYSEDLKNAFNVFNEKNVDFISCSGDISTDNILHLYNFKACFDKYSNGQSLYTCVGNHDTVLKARYKNDWKSIDHLNDKYGIVRFNDTDGTSFYFVKELPNNKKDVYIYLNLEYGYAANEWYNTHGPKMLSADELLTKDNVTYEDYHLYNPDTLQEFAHILERFANDRCFIFTHIMFKDKAGTYHGNALYNYYNTHDDVIRGDQGTFLRNLLEQYDNNYWFCGHSHYKWIWQELDKDINVTKTNNSYNIHLPSLSRPLPYGITEYSVARPDSEGAIMDVYEDYVIINGYVFKEGNVNSAYSKLADYDGELVPLYAHDMQTDSSRITITESMGIIYITIDKTSEDIAVFLDGNYSSNYTTHIPVMRFRDVMITDAEGNDITEDVLEEHKIGFRDNTTDPNVWNYYFEDNHIYTLESYGIIFKVSSGSKYKNSTVNIQFRCEYGFIDNEPYQNKINPIAIYKI